MRLVLRPNSPQRRRDRRGVAEVKTSGGKSLFCSEDQFVVPPLGGRGGCRSSPLRQALPPKGATTNCPFHCFRALPRDMKALLRDLCGLCASAVNWIVVFDLVCIFAAAWLSPICGAQPSSLPQLRKQG